MRYPPVEGNDENLNISNANKGPFLVTRCKGNT